MRGAPILLPREGSSARYRAARLSVQANRRRRPRTELFLLRTKPERDDCLQIHPPWPRPWFAAPARAPAQVVSEEPQRGRPSFDRRDRRCRRRRRDVAISMTPVISLAADARQVLEIHCFTGIGASMIPIVAHGGEFPCHHAESSRQKCAEFRPVQGPARRCDAQRIVSRLNGPWAGSASLEEALHCSPTIGGRTCRLKALHDRRRHALLDDASDAALDKLEREIDRRGRRASKADDREHRCTRGLSPPRLPHTPAKLVTLSRIPLSLPRPNFSRRARAAATRHQLVAVVPSRRRAKVFSR